MTGWLQHRSNQFWMWRSFHLQRFEKDPCKSNLDMHNTWQPLLYAKLLPTLHGLNVPKWGSLFQTIASCKNQALFSNLFPTKWYWNYLTFKTLTTKFHEWVSSMWPCRVHTSNRHFDNLITSKSYCVCNFSPNWHLNFNQFNQASHQYNDSFAFEIDLKSL